MEFLYEYGLFLAKAVTLVIAILVVIGSAIGLAHKHKKGKGHLEVQSLSDELDDMRHHTQAQIFSKDEYKQLQKAEKKAAKADKKAGKTKAKLFVIDFSGSMDAHEVDALRQEVTSVLAVARDDDEVLIRLESPGGVVHGYGLAASQLQRLRDRGLNLTVAVDKVAASGGYMMACVANKIISAKFAIIGSIGVIAQMPNFNRLLKANNIDFEQHTAGEFKRTLTIFGENDDKGREKFRQELEQIHQMFKGFVAEHRPDMNIDEVATGEYWYGIQAKEKGLVDELMTSDDYLLAANENRDVVKITYAMPKKLSEKLANAASLSVQQLLMNLSQRLPFINR